MKIAGIELPKDMAEAAEACRPHFVAGAIFSLFINLLFLAPAIYMLQVYDRVVATGGKMTLLFITIALAIGLMALAALDAIRNRLLVRASMRLDNLLSPKILKRMMARNSSAKTRGFVLPAEPAQAPAHNSATNGNARMTLLFPGMSRGSTAGSPSDRVLIFEQ